MVKDAEIHAEEDRKARELVEARNMAENMINATRKSLKELGDKVEEQEKNDIEAAVKDLEEVVQSDDKTVIEEKTQKLTEVASKLAERVYQQSAEQPEGQGAAGTDEQASGEEAGSGSENVVDAEFEEVDDDKK